MNKQLTIYILICLSTLFIGGLVGYAFNPKDEIIIAQPVDNGKRVIDSVIKEQQKFEQKAKADSSLLSKQIIVLFSAYNTTKSELSIERKKNLKLAEAVKEANLLNDTSSYFEYCNQLSERVGFLDNKVQQLQNHSDSLLLKNDSLNKLMASRVLQFSNSVGLLEYNSNKQSKTIDSLIKQNDINKKRLNRKYNVSIGGFGGLTNFGFGGGVGIVVGKNIFTF